MLTLLFVLVLMHWQCIWGATSVLDWVNVNTKEHLILYDDDKIDLNTLEVLMATKRDGLEWFNQQDGSWAKLEDEEPLRRPSGGFAVVYSPNEKALSCEEDENASSVVHEEDEVRLAHRSMNYSENEIISGLRSVEFPEKEDSSKVLIGFVVDGSNPKYLLQAITLGRSLRLSGGTMNGATVLALVLPNVPKEIREELQRLGFIVRESNVDGIKDLLPGATPHCNKLLFFDALEAQDHERFEMVIYLDCDLFVMGDVLPIIQKYGREKLLFRSGKVSWGEIVFRDPIWPALCQLAGVDPVMAKDYLGWPNTGVIMMPTKMVKAFHTWWFLYIDKISHWLTNILGQDDNSMYFLDTLAFIFAVVRTTEPDLLSCCVGLPVQANLQLNWPLHDFHRNQAYLPSLEQVEPFLVQYNQDTMQVFANGTIRAFNERQMSAFPFLRAVNKAIFRYNNNLVQIN